MLKVKHVVNCALNDESYLEVVKDIIFHSEVLKMKKFVQHGDTSCYDHCINVSYVGYLVAQKFGWDYVSIARAGLLHDMFLYDWREYKNSYHNITSSHAIIHGKIALENASKYFSLNEKEREMIKKHMWPITIFFPRYGMTYLVGIVDKYCAVAEFLSMRLHQKEDCTDP